MDWIHLAQDVLVAGSCENGIINPSVSIKAREFPDQLTEYQLIRKVSVPWS
jgi:hypothetical protein